MGPSTPLTIVLMILSAAPSVRAQQLPASGPVPRSVGGVAHLAQSDLDRSLESARSAWGIFTPVEIRLETIDLCARGPGSEVTMATTQLVTETTTTTSDDPEKPAVTIQRAFSIIHFNGNCKWNDQLLNDVMRHEYGHALGLGHSKSKYSVMNQIVDRQITLDGIPLGFKRKLSIMDEDRAAALRSQKKTD